MGAKTKARWAAGQAWGRRSAPRSGVKASAVNRRISAGRSTEGGTRAAVGGPAFRAFTHDLFLTPFVPDMLKIYAAGFGVTGAGITGA
jgi:hypothetical protein